MSIDKVGSSSQYETASKGVAKKNIAVGLTVGSGIVGGGALGYLGVDKFVKLVQKEAIPSKNLKIAGAIAGGALLGVGLASITGKALKMGKVKRSKNPDVNFVITTTNGQKIEYPFMLGCQTKIIPLPNKKYAVYRTTVVPNAETKSKIVTEEQLLNECSEFVK